MNEITKDNTKNALKSYHHHLNPKDALKKWIILCFNPLWFILLFTDIDAPKDLKATDVTPDSASLTWIPPLADIEGYILTYRDEEGNMEVLSQV